MLQGTVGAAVRSARSADILARLPRSTGLLLRAAAALTTFALLFTWPARLFDSDAYLHLALARTIAAHGLVDHLEWARFSTLGHAYGDKELLFHLLLVPFVKLFDAELGGKLALALLCAAIAASLWELGNRAIGRFGFLIPIFVFGSGSFMLRAIRLRPELLSLLIAVWVVWSLAERRYLLAAALSFAFALAHTAFHSLLGLALLFVAWQRWWERRWEWQLLAAVAGGIAFGLLAHPQFPRNLSVFWVQNFELFRLKDQLDVGAEFQPHTVTGLLQLDGLFWLGLIAVAGATAGQSGSSETARRMASFCWIATAAFGLLFLQMGRFATLAIPFAALAVCFGRSASSAAAAANPSAQATSSIGARVKLPAGRSLPSAVVLLTLAALSCANALAIAFVNWRMAGSFDPSLRRELDQLAQQLPRGASVAANWDDAELYAFHAPHARYLNVYDPVFMAVGDPARHAVWTDVLAGSLPDVPDAVSRALESEYIALSVGSHRELERRLANDPRARLLHLGRHAVFRIDSHGKAFITDWATEQQPATRLAAPSGYIDARSLLGPDHCATLVHDEIATTPRTRLVELAAWGPTRFFVDGRERMQLPAANLAQLGEGPALPLRVEPGSQRWTVRTCAHAGQAGFYLVERASR
jgi:hypothetical protein